MTTSIQILRACHTHAFVVALWRMPTTMIVALWRMPTTMPKHQYMHEYLLHTIVYISISATEQTGIFMLLLYQCEPFYSNEFSHSLFLISSVSEQLSFVHKVYFDGVSFYQFIFQLYFTVYSLFFYFSIAFKVDQSQSRSARSDRIEQKKDIHQISQHSTKY